MTALRPWREVAVPHSDVLKGTFQQAEFAVDITAVRAGKAPDIYQDATAFFDRTFITHGMRQLLTQVAPAGGPAAPKSKAFHGSVAVTASVAKSQLVTLADEIITLLAGDPTADVRVTLEIAADFPDGASDQIKRAISENATALSFDTAVWE